MAKWKLKSLIEKLTGSAPGLAAPPSGSSSPTSPISGTSVTEAPGPESPETLTDQPMYFMFAERIGLTGLNNTAWVLPLQAILEGDPDAFKSLSLGYLSKGDRELLVTMAAGRGETVADTIRAIAASFTEDDMTYQEFGEHSLLEAVQWYLTNQYQG